MQTHLKKGVYCLQAGLFGLLGLALLLALLSANAYANSRSTIDVSDGTWTTYTTAHGLPSNVVYGGVVVDDKGYVWAGFQNGELDYENPPPLTPTNLEATWYHDSGPGPARAPASVLQHGILGDFYVVVAVNSYFGASSPSELARAK